MSEQEQNSKAIKLAGQELGFDFIGFSKAEKLSEDDHLKEWLKNGYHGKMEYMENHFDKRLDPTELVPGCKTVISLLYNYYPEENPGINGNYKIARYAYGRDYHKVIKKKLKQMVGKIQAYYPDVIYRTFVDSAPVMERQWAAKGGIGWLGKNTLLINKEKGSYFFIADILIDKELSYDSPIDDYCGTCTKCLDACPTNAFESPYVLNASKCISYMTIELKDDSIPNQFTGKFNDWIFGCDICQEVCPWNRFSTEHQEVKFKMSDELKEMSSEDWEELNEKKFNDLFEGSAVKRTKFGGLKRNINFVKND